MTRGVLRDNSIHSFPSETTPKTSDKNPSYEQKYVIAVENLRKTYGEIVAADDVSFSVEEGEIFGIIGPNGAGKTTIVECISGLRVPDVGSITVFGLRQETNRKKLREQIGVQIQESSLPPNIKIREVMELFASFYENPADWDDLLDSLGIADKKNAKFKHLSGGQKQRLSIALALIGNPKIAILDELTTGLDPEARREAWDLIEDIRDKGVTILLVTHYMEEAERLCDRVALIVRGKIVVLDTPESIANRYGGGTQVRFLPSRPISDEILTSLEGVTDVKHHGRRIVVSGTAELPSQIIHALEGIGVKALEIQTRSGDLEEAFVRLTKKEEARKIGGP